MKLQEVEENLIEEQGREFLDKVKKLFSGGVDVLDIDQDSASESEEEEFVDDDESLPLGGIYKYKCYSFACQTAAANYNRTAKVNNRKSRLKDYECKCYSPTCRLKYFLQAIQRRKRKEERRMMYKLLKEIQDKRKCREKMRWYVTFSLCICATLFVAVLGQLCLSSYLLWSNDENPPLDLSDEWMTHVIALIPFSVVYMLLCVFTLWVLLSQDKMRFFICLIIGNFLFLIFTVYFAVIFSIQRDSAPASAETLFENTKIAIIKKVSETGDTHFIFPWLDVIQKESVECCGIQTFRDWEEFWPELKSDIPKSCCKDPDGPLEKCPANLGAIPYPGTPSMFIKTDTGCMDEINDKVWNNIHQTFVYSVIICCLMAIAVLAYLIQFYQQYVPFTRTASPPIDGGGGDADNCPCDQTKDIDPYNSGGQTGFLDFSGYSGSLQGSTGSIQDPMGNLNTDMGDFGAVAISMNSYDQGQGGQKLKGLGSRGGSSSALPRMQSLGTVNNHAPGSLSNLLPGSSSSSDMDVDETNPTGETTNPDGTKKKRRKKKPRKSQEESTGTTDGGVAGSSTVNRQEVFMAPDNTAILMDDFPADNLFSGSGSVSPNASLDEVGDQLADGMRPKSKKDKGKPIGMTRNRRNR